jgi:very-short-patch-repair endonuclease
MAMMMLAHPPNQMHAETTTAEALEALRPAVGSVLDSMVKADVRRLEPWIGFKNGCVVSPRQGGSCAEHVRSSDRESGMVKETAEDIIRKFAALEANLASAAFIEDVEFRSERCESPIERVMLASMMFHFGREHRTMFGGGGPLFPLIEYVWPDPLFMPGCHIYQQALIGDYRVDFFIAWETAGKARPVKKCYVVIECDGHDFHERTKEQAARDRSRDRWMASQGITVLRFTGSEIWSRTSLCASDIMDVLWRLMGWIDPETGNPIWVGEP